MCLLSYVVVLFSRSVVSNSLWSHGLQHTRLPSSPISPGICWNSCPLSWWCHPTISSCVVLFSLCPQSFQHQGLFQWVSSLNQVPKCFSISPTNEYSGLIFFRINLFDHLAVQGTLKSLLQHRSSKDSSLALSLLYGSTLTSVHDYQKNHSVGYMDLCQQSHVSPV